MNKIKRDFVAKELRSLAGLMVMMAAALGYIIFYVRISPLAFALIPLIVSTVEKHQKGRHQKKQRMEGFYVKSTSTKPRIFQSD